MYTTFPTTTEKNLLCSWNGQNNQNKWLRNIFSVWTLRFHLLLGTTCSAKRPSCVFLWVNCAWFCRCYWHVVAKAPCWWPPVSRITCMNVLTCIIFKVSLAVNLSSASISADSSERHGWKKKKDLNNQNKSVTPQNVLSNKAALANAKKVKVVQSFSIPKVPYLLEKAPRCLWNIWTCRQSAYFRATGAGLIKNFVFANNTLLHNIPFFFNVLFESDNNGTWRT